MILILILLIFKVLKNGFCHEQILMNHTVCHFLTMHMGRQSNQKGPGLVADMSATTHLWKNPFCQADLFFPVKHFGGTD
jgi:hypothetical protein